MGKVSSGVFPVFDIDFKIGTKGLESTESDLVKINDMTTFELTIDGNIEEWNPMNTKGWKRVLNTGKGCTITLNGKRSIGDPGNDYVASLAFKTGTACYTKAKVEIPDGATLEFNCVVNVKSFIGGESTNVAPLEFDLIFDGEPNWTDAPAPTPEV